MKLKNTLACLAAASLVLQPVAALAADAPPPPATAKAPVGPSAFVRCDGFPNKASTLGTVARLVAITAVIGLLLPQREAYDPKKRENGADGVKACDEALSGAEPAKDGGRRIELIFGRAIHRMEMQDWDGAIADINSVSTDQPDLTATLAYKQSLGLTAIELRAMALTGKGDFAGAHALGLELANQAPFDIKAQLSSLQYLALARSYGPAEMVVYDQASRAFPLALLDRAAARAVDGRFLEAASDYKAFSDLVGSIPKARGYPSLARSAIAYRLGGNATEGDKLLKLALAAAEADAAQGKTDTPVTAANEANDLYAILVALDSGQAMRARTLFSARTRWPTISAGLVAGVAARLETVGTAAERANTPIPTAKEVLAADQARVAAQINNTGDDNSDRFDTYRWAFAQTDFGKFAANVWKTDKSRYVTTPKKDIEYGEFVDTSRNGTGTPAGYALLLHLALLTKARGHSHFMMMPAQSTVYRGMFRTGTPGDGKVFAEMAYDPDKVIAALSPLIPQPVKK
ncbi:hypothetical protein [Novosphingobium jiangmenense]|uniref:Uncharacterized protein n=1 Tax=Novosphingobium jiangmenense TaxID=2791981 RepID=A0ABS0HD03_9SPHN|nr:hypothetical protein [Novosphingobium jiangmenense]MBF9150149.1 hypothetical protein [Novosphingobium jiangmenense]